MEPRFPPALAVLLLACAHAPAPPEVEVAAVEARAEAGEDQSAPVRKSCKGRGPRIPEGETVTGLVDLSRRRGRKGERRERDGQSVAGRAQGDPEVHRELHVYARAAGRQTRRSPLARRAQLPRDAMTP